jgi:threonine/homoserine/homoserine lactone efflux protein
LARSEAMQDWVPVSQVIGNITVPAATSGFGATQAGPRADLNPPPNLHWGIVLLLTIITCWIFGVIWLFVQAAWVKKVRPNSRAIFYLIGYLVLAFAAAFIDAEHNRNPVAGLLQLGAIVLVISAVFSMRGDIEDYYNTEENIGLSLNGVMTFFFAIFYFQYHFNRINRWKQTGVLE